MTVEFRDSQWQEIGWNGLVVQLPATWQPTVIYPAYLFFEHEGKPVFEIKWQNVRGRFSAEKALGQIQESLPKETRLNKWDLPEDLRQLVSSFTAEGFQLQQDNYLGHGLVLFCPACKQATLLQWYIETGKNRSLLVHILGSLKDHSETQEQLWSLYDIRAWLPADALLRSHEFLPGKYTLSFDYKGVVLTLYRYKPAAVLLEKESISEFGSKFMETKPMDEGNGWATWQTKAEGINLLLAKLRRKPLWNWMRLWHDPEHNVILGVKAEGKYSTKHDWLGKICNDYKPTLSK